MYDGCLGLLSLLFKVSVLCQTTVSSVRMLMECYCGDVCRSLSYQGHLAGYTEGS